MLQYTVPVLSVQNEEDIQMLSLYKDGYHKSLGSFVKVTAVRNTYAQ